MRICKNEITDHIREQFGANPLKIPESRVQPLCVLEIRKGKQQFLGEFQYLVKGGFSYNVPVKEEVVARVSDKRSRATEFDIGFDILGGYLKALGLEPLAIKASLQTSQKLAFTFRNVKRRYLDILRFGQVISDNDVFGDTNNFVLRPAMEEDVRLGLITDVFISNNFSLTTLTESESAVDIDVPAISKILGETHATVKVTPKSKNEVQFEGPEQLTFAFSCLEIMIDPDTGKFSRGDWMQNLKSASGDERSLDSLKPGEEHMLDHVLIDKNTEYPLLIEL